MADGRGRRRALLVRLGCLPRDLMARHFVEIAVPRSTPHRWGCINLLNVDGIGLVDWVFSRVDEALNAGSERALAEVLGKHERWPHELVMRAWT